MFAWRSASILASGRKTTCRRAPDGHSLKVLARENRHHAPVSRFRGFSPEAVEFLRELEENNERDWFKANRARYEEHLRAPVAALGEDLAALGRPRLFRPWNDTRFHPGPPIKEHVGLAIGHEGAGGFYVEMSLDGLLIAAGLHKARAGERIRAELEAAAPLVRWLREHVGASQRPTARTG
jgi:hypothetical protein